jgi:hypothetical protein
MDGAQQYQLLDTWIVMVVRTRSADQAGPSTSFLDAISKVVDGGTEATAIITAASYFACNITIP